jgi:hypothetical protein
MDDRAMQVWTALAEMYGQTLLTNFGAEPPPLWRSKIGELTDAQIAQGLRAMSERESSYAPALGEFVAACKGTNQPPRPHLTGLPPPPREEVDGWTASLNRMLMRHAWLAQGRISPPTLQKLLAYKRAVARDLREAYPRKPGPKDEMAAIEENVHREFARIIREAA